MYEKKMIRESDVVAFQYDRHPARQVAFENTSIYSYIMIINPEKRRMYMNFDYRKYAWKTNSPAGLNWRKYYLRYTIKLTISPACLITLAYILCAFIDGCTPLPNAFGTKINKTPKNRAYEEIRYIASPIDKDRFDSLNTAEEIKIFVDEFWSKRDPTPDTPQNELREEVDSRIAYADSMLGGSNLDRGRVYIIYGKPHEIKYYDWQKEGGLLSKFHDYNTDYYGQPEVNNNQPVTLRANTVEVWIYNVPTRNHPVQSIFDNYDNVDRALVKFIFADVTSFGLMTQIYSTEVNEKCDPRVFTNGRPGQ
jgi:GWxTD domain-containing protein